MITFYIDYEDTSTNEKVHQEVEALNVDDAHMIFYEECMMLKRAVGYFTITGGR
jgi:hypothetical protein